jgi:hypothetical protein
MWFQTIIHYFLHLVFPIFIALAFFRKDWKTVYFILLATMLIDLDHLLADPIFQANRCSVNFHVLHSNYAILVYFVLLFLKRPFKIIGIGLLFHILTDLIDCIWSYINSKPPPHDYSFSEIINYAIDIFR